MTRADLNSDFLQAQTIDSCPASEFTNGTLGVSAGTVSQWGSLPCVHCGLATECSAASDPNEIFCCSGCLGAYQLIHGWGLQDFYALRDQMKLSGAAQPAGKSSRYEQFDIPEFLGPSQPVLLSDGNCAAEFAVHGLHCAACAWLIENAAAREPGLLSARVRMSDHSIRFVFAPEQTKLSRIAQLLDGFGYSLAPIDPNRDDQVQRTSRRLLGQIAIAGFCAANAMWIAVALYAGEFSGLAAEHRYFLGLIGTALGVATVVGPGRTFFVGALAAIRTRTPHMDLPVALGLTVGTVVGTVNAIAGRGQIYFDSMATLVFFLLIGRWIQFRQQQQAAKAVDLMLRITPRQANLVGRDGQEKIVLVDTLMVGDTIRVAAGESVAADGTIQVGRSTIDRSLLTGESEPVHVAIGDCIAAGTINISAPFDLEVTSTGRESRIGRVLQSVEAAAAERTPMVQLADRIGGIFVVAVTLLACVTFVFWLPSGLSLATSNATALLIVACPCALALATPLTIAVGLGRAAKRHILIRDGQVLQQLASVGTLWFDKTGTLTEGQQRVSTRLGSSEGLRLAAGVENACRHPVAQAIVREVMRLRLSLPTDVKLERVVQGGVVGVADGHRVCAGNLQFIKANDVALSAEFERKLFRLARRGESPILIAIDGVTVSLLGMSDPLRAGARELVAELASHGWRLGILSGDHPAIVQRVAEQLGLPLDRSFGGLTPEEKLAAIRESRRSGRSVVMVGDGANDAAALAAADVGVALRGGAEISLQAAPVFIASGRLNSLSTLLAGAQRTTQVVYMNFVLSLGYNVLVVSLAIFGKITPLVAAVLMPISSVSVLALTLSIPSFRAPKP